jgi:hypothetical protein
MEKIQKSSVNLQDGVWVAVRPSPGWRTRALRASRTTRERLVSTGEHLVASKRPASWSSSAMAGSKKLVAQGAAPQSIVWQWEYGSMSPWRLAMIEMWTAARRPLRLGILLLLAFLVGWKVASGPDAMIEIITLRDHILRSENDLKARQGELELARLQMARMNMVMQNSQKYRIPADLAAEIYDIARSEGIDPEVAFNLVNVESEFTHKAVSPKGAVGLTQVMPSTAFEMNPRLRYEDLFERKTNLHLGFRYLRDLIRQYNGNLRYALLAYNRGPARVDEIRRMGGDPENGYANAILSGKGQ